MMGVLALGLIQAYRTFSGYDPLTLSPKSLVNNLLSSDSAYELLTGLLSFNPSTSLSTAKKLLSDKPKNNSQSVSKDSIKANLKFRFALVADSHKDNQGLNKALSQAKASGAKFVIGLGDYSEVGTVDELRLAKQQFDTAGLAYYLTAGDHDLWDSRNKNLSPEQNFKEIFGSPFQSFSYENARFLLIYNSDNYLGIDSLQLKWIEDELSRISSENGVSGSKKVTFSITHIPLYHPSSDHIMGKENPKLRNQTEHLRSLFKRHNISEVFYGDTHFYSHYTDPENSLSMTSVGAVTSERNPQSPRFALVDVFDDGSYNITDVEIR